MGDNAAHRDVVRATPEQIVEALTDFGSYPQWQTGVQETTVVERDGDGRGTVVDMTVDAKVRKVRYRVRYFYDLDHGRLGWDYVGGDLKDCTGRYTLTARADGSTDVAIDIVTEVGFFVPKPMMRMIRDQALKNSMRDLKKRLGV